MPCRSIWNRNSFFPEDQFQNILDSAVSVMKKYSNCSQFDKRSVRAAHRLLQTSQCLSNILFLRGELLPKVSRR